MIKSDFIARIEGHGNLNVNWSERKVQLNVLEGERLFEGILVGRTAEEMHWITPRICGVCPTAHNLAALNALENALGIKLSQTTVLLRDLMMAGQMIQSHTLHLFFLSLPDYLGIDRGTELAKKNPALFKDALSLKDVSDYIVKIVAGRIVHPTTSTIGGFHKIPTKQDLEKILGKLEQTEKAAFKVVKLASSLDYPELKVDLELVAQVNDLVVSVSSVNIKGRKQSSIANYKSDIEEEVKSYSTAKFARYKGEVMLVGSLARLAVSGYSDQSYKLDFANPFHNNFAQAIEILYYHQKATNIIRKLLKSKLDSRIVKPSKSPSLFGIGVIEAPRGGLYHEVRLDKDGIIKQANIITPTVQNLSSIEKSAQALLNQNKSRSQKELERLLVMLVRAYDPCLTCSVH